MKILSAQQIREWDAYTIAHEPIKSIDLMERAAKKCVDYLLSNLIISEKKIIIFCGVGNNGGDGLAIARLLKKQGIDCTLVIIGNKEKSCADFNINLQSAIDAGVDFATEWPPLLQINSPQSLLIIDALFGTGVNRLLDNSYKNLIDAINGSNATVVSIDMPSGMYADTSSKGNIMVKATITLSFQCIKKALLIAENSEYFGKVEILDIGLSNVYYEKVSVNGFLIDDEILSPIFKTRGTFSHKGTFGHALLIAGSEGMCGAAAITTRACLRSGAGLTTAAISQVCYPSLQRHAPEATVKILSEDVFWDVEKYDAVGIGPGLGTDKNALSLLKQTIEFGKALVIDADALNLLAANKSLLNFSGKHCILTPHPKECSRLFGTQSNDFESIETAKAQSKLLNAVIVLKGHHTCIACPDDSVYFNTTGNSGMAKGGSGDVLTGLITGLVAQGNSPKNAAILGVYLHGLAGDFAAQSLTEESMTAMDIIENLTNAFKKVKMLLQPMEK